MKKTVQRDMTKGSPTRIILGFTLPLFLGNVFQQFYNMADTIIVGQFVGTGALAAVGSTGTIMFLIIRLCHRPGDRLYHPDRPEVRCRGYERDAAERLYRSGADGNCFGAGNGGVGDFHAPAA